MEDDFQKTVNLKERMRKAQPANDGRKTAYKSLKKARPSKAEAIDQVFNDEESKLDFQKISRPVNSKGNGKDAIYKQVIFILIVIIIAFGFYLFNSKDKETEIINNVSGWYSVELDNKEIYYGQIDDLSPDPVVLKNVYYNYDQINSKSDDESKKNSDIRLVKHGSETQGGDGSISFVRTHVVDFKPLGDDGLILKAILDYEK